MRSDGRKPPSPSEVFAIDARVSVRYLDDLGGLNGFGRGVCSKSGFWNGFNGIENTSGTVATQGCGWRT